MSHFDSRIDLMVELGLRKEALEPVRRYLDLLWTSNEELNLISRKMTFEELVDNHLIDCLLPISHFPTDVKVAADFGAGGGLPGVLYAIQFPEIEYRLFEKSPKKQEFLNRCKVVAPNLVVKGEIPQDLGDVDLITARAFKPIDVILDISRKYYANKGRYFLLKGRKEKIDEETALAKKKFKDLVVNAEPLKSPILEVERHLVTIN